MSDIEMSEPAAAELFVSGIAQEATEKDIKDYFASFGEVASVTLKWDNLFGQPVGFAFVVFNEVETLNAVLAQDHAIKGHQVAVKKAASKQGKIYVGKFKDPNISEGDISHHFRRYGMVTFVHQPVDRSKDSEPKNFCFVNFEKEDVATFLIKRSVDIVCGNSHFLLLTQSNLIAPFGGVVLIEAIDGTLPNWTPVKQSYRTGPAVQRRCCQTGHHFERLRVDFFYRRVSPNMMSLFLPLLFY